MFDVLDVWRVVLHPGIPIPRRGRADNGVLELLEGRRQFAARKLRPTHHKTMNLLEERISWPASDLTSSFLTPLHHIAGV
ncbi:hypothetical protein I551_7780 [Mycobacterium ulcerans str. Harvey]|uniref:Transposase n=1 Tax=Mycobacterium ulcerans str. Harvey TaxID=1299332 RepID=A0ABN0QM69_MYCUL|nr:hypothetical protein I551_7780 [Mycobacterium ulcerans str. Harvey]